MGERDTRQGKPIGASKESQQSERLEGTLGGVNKMF